MGTHHLALVGATIYVDATEEPVHDSVVLMDQGKITAVGPRSQVERPRDTRVLDCTGCTVAAGFWNSHVHLAERKWSDAANIPASELSQQLEDMFSRFGFTTAFDLSSSWENTRTLRDRVDSGEVRGPRIYSTGLALLPANPRLPSALWHSAGFPPSGA